MSFTHNSSLTPRPVLPKVLLGFIYVVLHDAGQTECLLLIIAKCNFFLTALKERVLFHLLILFFEMRVQ